MSNVSISAVFPVYNEAPAVIETLQRAEQVLRTNTKIEQYEIILVDDGSTDGALDRIPISKTVRILRHERNRGYGAALKTGINEARHPLIMICDADGSYTLEDFPRLLDAWSPFKMVVAQRDRIAYSRAAWAKRLMRRLFNLWLFLITYRSVPDINSGFRLFERERVSSVLKDLSDRFSFTSGLTIHWLLSGQPVAYIPSHYVLRKGESKVHFLKDSFRVFVGTLRFVLKRKPQRLAIPLAILIAVVWTVSWSLH